MRQEYAIITNGKVTGKAAVDTTSEPFTIPDNWIQSKKAKRGDAYDGSKFTTPAPKPEPPKEIRLDELTRDEKIALIDKMVTDNILTTERATEIKGNS